MTPVELSRRLEPQASASALSQATFTARVHELYEKVSNFPQRLPVTAVLFASTLEQKLHRPAQSHRCGVTIGNGHRSTRTTENSNV